GELSELVVARFSLRCVFPRRYAAKKGSEKRSHSRLLERQSIQCANEHWGLMKTPGIQSILLLAPVALICALCLAPLRAQFAQTQSDAITVQVDRPGAAISPTLFGLFFEDINFGADGGLYPERVKNRSFEFPDPMMGWKRLARGEAKGALQIYDAGSRSDRPNAHYLQIKSDSGGGFGLTNEGFRGIGVEQGKEYLFSV